MYNESKDSTFQKRTQLVAHINHFYQLCVGSKQHTFFYVDLIKPCKFDRCIFIILVE